MTRRIHRSFLRRAPRLLAATSFLIVAVLPARLQSQAVGRIAAERFTLSNGLDVVLAADSTTQVVAVDIWYDAGSRTEPSHKAGLARLFERLMLAGPARLARGAAAAMVERVGGSMTSEVDEEAARFGLTLPSNRLNLGLWLTADRMAALAINDTTVGEARLDVLGDLNRTLNEEPYNAAIITAVANLYDSAACPGYAHPSIGRVGTLTGLTTVDAKAFFRERFGPNNARLVIAGNFDPGRARQLVTEYFGSIPRGPDPDQVTCSADFGEGARPRPVRDRRVPRTAVGQLYRIPGHDHADAPALELLGIIMSQGQESRLTKILTSTLRVAVGTQGGILGDRRGPAAFALFAIAAPGVTADSLGALLSAQAAWAATDGLSEADLTRAKNIYRATAVSARERPADIAALLQHAALFHADANAVNTEPERVLAVSLPDVRRVARAWLSPERALTLAVTPEEAS